MWRTVMSCIKTTQVHYNLHARWQNWASENTINQKLNPFSEDFAYEYSMSTLLRKGEEERARRAEAYIPQEIDDMCFIIRTMADLDPDGYTRVTFGDLFDRYVRISYKVVGILMRARKPVFAYLSVCMYNDLFHLIILCK
uniref:Actin binding Rho activating protein b n=1 Tax=Cyprinus carpio TaxID=7962 RepID=A0A8C2KVH8_CYPCA